jgi:hypothetical protein
MSTSLLVPRVRSEATKAGASSSPEQWCSAPRTRVKPGISRATASARAVQDAAMPGSTTSKRGLRQWGVATAVSTPCSRSLRHSANPATRSTAPSSMPGRTWVWMSIMGRRHCQSSRHPSGADVLPSTLPGRTPVQPPPSVAERRRGHRAGTSPCAGRSQCPLGQEHDLVGKAGPASDRRPQTVDGVAGDQVSDHRHDVAGEADGDQHQVDQVEASSCYCGS